MRARFFMFRAKRYTKRVYIAAKRKVVNFVVGTYRHWEAIAILVLASLGLNSLFGEVPFYMLLPAWIEATMVIPILAVLGITLLVKSAEWRAGRRNMKAAAFA